MRFLSTTFIFTFLFIGTGLRAQPVQITPLDSANILTELSNVVFGGCVQISNLSYSGIPAAFGHFTDPDSSLGIADGLVMSTGLVSAVADSASAFASNVNGTGGDTDLQIVSGTTNYDAAVLEFDFIPNADTIFASQFIFGSEEYPEWVCTPFNDVFAFIITGVTTADPPTNVALIPNTSIPIAINSVNGDPNCNGDYSMYYMDNSAGTEVVFDGLTTLLPLSYAVIPGETYHMKIAVGDGSDQIFDSGIFLKAQTFCGNFWYQNAQFLAQDMGGLTYSFTNQSYAAESYWWDFGDGTYSSDAEPTHTYANPGNYQVTLTCTNSCQVNDNTVTVNALVTNIAEDLSGAALDVFVANGGTQLMLRFEDDNSHQLSLQIVDLSGRVVSVQPIGTTSQTTVPVDISGLQTGIYVARVSNGTEFLQRKFVK